MKAQHLQTIREACIKANPEIEGKHFFGVGFARCRFCNVERVVRDRKVYNRVVDKHSGGSSQEVEVTDYNMEGGPCPEHMSRSIRLAEVLLAIGNKDYQQMLAHQMQETTLTMISSVVAQTIYHWNLRKDDLTEQSDECIEFLANLLSA